MAPERATAGGNSVINQVKAICRVGARPGVASMRRERSEVRPALAEATAMGGSVDQEIRHLVDELARRPEVLGVALFGSVARGDARPDSDVDVFVLVKDGTWRDVEQRGQRHVEFVFSSPERTQMFGERRPDEYVQMWQDAQVLLDKEGRMAELRQAADDLRAGGKPRPDRRSIRHWQFDAQDQLRGVRGLRARDLPTAALVLHRHVEALTALFFDLVQEWTPPPKQRLKRIRELNPVVAEAFDRFYALADLDEQMRAAEQVVARLFEMVERSLERRREERAEPQPTHPRLQVPAARSASGPDNAP